MNERMMKLWQEKMNLLRRVAEIEDEIARLEDAENNVEDGD